MSEKILSIIVPSYNMEKYLPKCLGSLIVSPELMERLEVMVVNDGSKDRTSEIAHEFAAKWPNTFKVIDKANGHYGSCVNAGLAIVSGKYVRILDADDYVDTSLFSEFLSVLENCNADVVITGMRTVNPDGCILFENVGAIAPARTVTSIDNLHGTSLLWVHQLVYRTSIFSGGWYKQIEGQQYTDCQWSGTPMLRVKTLYYHDKPVSCYLVGRAGQSMDPAVRIRCLSQQINIDLYLAMVYSKGRPKDCERGAWDYFERLTFRELGRIYETCILTAHGDGSLLALLNEFIKEVKGIDPMIVRKIEQFPHASRVSVMKKLFVFNYVKSYNGDSRWLFGLKRWAYMCYAALRGHLTK